MLFVLIAVYCSFMDVCSVKCDSEAPWQWLIWKYEPWRSVFIVRWNAFKYFILLHLVNWLDKKEANQFVWTNITRYLYQFWYFFCKRIISRFVRFELILFIQWTSKVYRKVRKSVKVSNLTVKTSILQNHFFLDMYKIYWRVHILKRV